MSELFFTKQAEDAWRLDGGRNASYVPKRNSDAVKRQKGRQAARRSARTTKDSRWRVTLIPLVNHNPRTLHRKKLPQVVRALRRTDGPHEIRARRHTEYLHEIHTLRRANGPHEFAQNVKPWMRVCHPHPRLFLRTCATVSFCPLLVV